MLAGIVYEVDYLNIKGGRLFDWYNILTWLFFLTFGRLWAVVLMYQEEHFFW
jgi:hypothetical protein